MKWHQTQRFSIRKYSFGAASVLLATVSFMTGQTASADETTPVDSLSTLTANNSAEPTSQVVSTGTPASPAQTTVAQSVPADAVSPEAPAVTKTNQVSSAPTVAPSSQATVAAETSQAKATPVQAQASTNQPSATTSTGSPVTSETVRTSSTQSLGETRAAAAGPVSNPAPNVAPSGSYVFTETTGVKSEPKLSSPDLAQYQKGQTVNYDSVVNADQHKWLSYVSYGGARRYVSIGSIAPTPTPVPVASTTSRSASTAKSASQGNYDVFNRIVYLDAGHGGTDPGAVYFGTHEKALNLEIQKRVKSKLEAQGFRVELTRSSDTGLDLLPRSEKANKTSSDIFVSIHFNAASTPSVNGIETYYYQSYAEYPARVNAQYHNNAQRLNLSASLASSIQSKLIANTGARNAGVKRQTFAVLRETTAPAVLLELGYMSNSAEFAKISSAAYQEKLATGIVQGIADYYKKHASLPATSVVTKPAPAAPVKTTIVAKGSTGFDVTITNVPAVMTSVRVPVWSDKSGQDDIKWYTAQSKGNGTYTLSVSTANHNFEVGKYNVHVYGQNSQTGKLEGLTATTVTLAAPTTTPAAPVKTTVVAKGSTGFDVTITNVPVVMTSVRVPVWSDKSGQDDIKWYTAQSKGNGTYTLSVSTANHNFDLGKYNVHVYGQNSQIGKLEGLTATTVTLAAPTTTPAAPVKTTVVAKGSTGFDVTITNVPAVMTSVRVPVWSDKSGQDDIKWYTAQSKGNGTYTLSVSTANHNFDLGKYNVHVYGQNSQKGKLEGLQATAVTLVAPAPKPTEATPSPTPAKIVTTAVAKGSTGFDVTITNVPAVMTSVRVPVWSDKSGQDDIKWYTAQSKGNGTYTLSVSTANHNFEVGKYNVHVYGQNSQTGKLEGLQATAVTLAAPTTTPAASVKTTVVAKDSTGFDVTITNVPAVMTSVRVPVWSDKSGQDDIKWYTAQSRGNGTYTLSVSTANHNFEVGKYNIHVYGQNSQKGKLEGLQATAVTLVSSAQNQSKPEASAKVDIKTSYRGTGVYGVDVTNVTNKGDVLFAVWSNTNGQDDLKWYPTKQISPSVYTATFDTKTHKNTGTYHIHVYQKIDGKMVGIGAVTQNVTKNTFNLPTKRQGDPRWGGLVYGRGNLAMTGCVPTALSMVYSALTSTDVSPVTVANYLYHNTNHFNKNFLGTSSLGIFSANQKWGLKSNTLNTQNDLATTLKEGHYVVAAVQGNKFVASSNPAVSHEIVLHGYKDGSTLVTDPFTGRTEWYSISRLFNEASRDKDDTAHKGKPFIKITDHF
ncbi:GBS Bsp-like repeat-containing protein [Streptococcus pluranimalium]